jgi:acetyl-CoA synthetase
MTAKSLLREAYAGLHRDFRWAVPAAFNIAEACCGRWARRTPQAPAVRHEDEAGQARCWSYRELQDAADRLSQVLKARGVGRGDRVAIVMPQRFETAVAHMADETAIDAVAAARAECPALRTVIAVVQPGAGGGSGDLNYTEALQAQSGRFAPVPTQADDAAVLIYTSGTTGPAKGALIPHRALIGNLPGFVCSQNGFGFSCFSGEPRPGVAPEESDAVFWSPADWAWTGGLMDALLPTLYFGRPIVAAQGRFHPEKAFALIERHGVTHTFLFPTALKAMMKAVPRPRERFKLQRLQAIMSAGEAVGDAVFGYCREQLGITVNEMFGQTEINYIIGNCAMNGRHSARVGWPARPGSMGRPYPGHRVAVIDEDGRECPPGTPGDVAVHRLDIHGQPDPVFFLGYLNNEAATQAKYTGSQQDSWCRTGDMALMDEDGYLWYQGRGDDMFKAAGYRIGPGEIENCLIKHPAVANAAVVPKPDAERGALVKAYVVLAPGFEPGPALVDALQQHVRGRLAPYEYPKEIEFADALPMTTTGKVLRRVLRLQEEERARAGAADAVAP